MIIEVDNFLSDEDFNYFDSIIKKENFYEEMQTPFKGNDSVNYYFRNQIAPSDEYSLKLKNYFKKEHQLNIEIFNTFINYVNTDTNEDDMFHQDACDLSLVIFLNDNFVGGELEFEDERKKQFSIKANRNKAIIIKNKLMHRVKKVIEGRRYTIVFFMNFEKKINKTAI